ncbi:TetR/AcrR family transcriptional regulator [Lactobacillus xylocopicola]|uniref:TetR family transcriptional regulator n=1 Tax=Lactobacillus xylocopicola TaxID=2976676 RepID=A0ABM8BEY4_9LACO|nr:TetR/AcrR family transcriptional regulator [Lactobacillus xylocopicola]BDR59794.1 TetR family transcriptional regulator [Lactobacillus xylocopicola]
MSRGFTEEEKKELKERLIQVFIEELNHQKISSINIDDLVKKVGIAKGSFYHFFKSKDDLFAEVINKIQDNIINKSTYLAEEDKLPAKDRLKKILLYLVATIGQYPWIKQLSNVEYAKLIRRLPDDAKEKLRQKDITDLTRILEILNLKTVYPYENITVMVQIIFSSALNKDDYGDKYDESIKILVDILIDHIFTERR